MSQIQIGSRVAINSFKFKGQEGIVKYVGEVEEKGIGLWVGVELDLPKGDMDGTMNGKFLFECKQGHGLLLRSTQVKVISAPQHQMPELNLGSGGAQEDSPLLTPKDPPLKQLMSQLVSGQPKSTFMQSQQQNLNQATDGVATENQEAPKTQSWRDRLETLRKQKEAKKQQEANNEAPAEEQKKEVQELKQVVAPSPGIMRNKDGKLAVNKEEAKSLIRPKAQETPAPVIKEEPIEEAQPVEVQEEKKKPSGLAMKIGAGLRQATTTGSKLGATKTGTAAAKGGATAATDTAKEKLMKKNEEVKAKLESRQSVTGPEKPAGTATRTTLSRANNAAVAKEAAEKRHETQGNLQQKVGQGLKLGLRKPGEKVDTKDAVNDVKQSAQQSARPLTARGAKEETKAEPSGQPKRTGLASRQGLERSTTRSKLGMQKTEETQPSTKQAIIEEEEDTQPPQIRGVAKRQAGESPTKSPTKISQAKAVEKGAPQSNEIQMAFGGGVNQAELKKLETDLRKKKEENFSLQIEVKELSSKISDLQKEHNDKLEEIKTEYEIKILELEQKLNDNTLLQKMEGQHKELQQQLQEQQRQMQQSLQAQIDELKKGKVQAEKEVAEYKKQLETAEEDKKRLQVEIEAKQADIEIIQLETEALREEKEELLNQIKMASEMNDQSALAGLSEDELKNQNTKLRQAISTLTMNFEVEKSRFLSKISDLEQRAKLVDEYEKKIEDMDILIEEVDLKDQEIKAMEEKLDECLEFEKMVEEMAEELLKKEEENEELQEKIKELEEMNAVQEELNENQENYLEELNEDIAKKDAEIFNFEQNVEQLEEMVLDQDQKIQKYKEKCNELNQKCKMLQEELQSAYAAGDQKVKISTLIEKQNQLISKLREAGKKDTEIMVHKIEFWQEKLKMKVVEGFIPKRLTEETSLDSLERVQLLNKVKNKALLLTREICEKQITYAEQLHEDKDQQLLFVKLLINISENSIKFIDSCNRIMLCIYKMPIEKYQEVTRLNAWTKFAQINQFIDKLMELLKEEALIPKFDISTYIQTIKSIQDLQYTVESRYIEKTKDERAEEEKSGEKTFDLSVAQQDRQRDIKYSFKFNLRNECLKMALAIMSLSVLNQNRSDDNMTKCKLIYWRLLDIIFKIDSINGQDNGQDYLNLGELATDTRLEQKFATIKALWQSEQPQSEQEPQERDWTYVLEAIERDITTLNNDYKFKKLVNKIDDEFRDQQIHIDDIYSKGWDNKGPWTLIVDKIRQDLEDTGAMKDKIEVLQEKVKDQAMQYLILKREKDELLAVNQSLEKRLADTQSKAEKVPALEMEKKRLQEKEQYFVQQMEMVKKELDTLREREKELQGKLQDMENNPMLARESFKGGGIRKQTTTVASTTNAQARQSRTSHFFKQIAQSSLLNKRDSFVNTNRQNTSVNSSELQKQLQITEEVFTNVIMELQKDRMMLKGQNMLERLNKLEKNDGSFNQYIAKQRERNDAIKRLNKDEQNKLENALDNVQQLKLKVKKEMALIKVVDLTKRQQAQEAQKGEESMETNKEKINYMIVKAKDQVNDAFKILFAKDSKLHQLKPLADSQSTSLAQATSTTQLVEKALQSQEERVKIGSIRMNGLLTEKRIINLNPNAIKDLKTNLAVFGSQ